MSRKTTRDPFRVGDRRGYDPVNETTVYNALAKGEDDHVLQPSPMSEAIKAIEIGTETRDKMLNTVCVVRVLSELCVRNGINDRSLFDTCHAMLQNAATCLRYFDIREVRRALESPVGFDDLSQACRVMLKPRGSFAVYDASLNTEPAGGNDSSDDDAPSKWLTGEFADDIKQRRSAVWQFNRK